MAEAEAEATRAQQRAKKEQEVKEKAAAEAAAKIPKAKTPYMHYKQLNFAAFKDKHWDAIQKQVEAAAAAAAGQQEEEEEQEEAQDDATTTTRSTANKSNQSQYTGVCRNKDRWEVRIRIGRKQHYLGCYVLEKDAAAAYIEAAKVKSMDHPNAKAILSRINERRMQLATKFQVPKLAMLTMMFKESWTQLTPTERAKYERLARTDAQRVTRLHDVAARTCPHCTRVFKSTSGQRVHTQTCKGLLTEAEILALPPSEQHKERKRERHYAALAQELLEPAPPPPKRQTRGQGVASPRTAETTGHAIDKGGLTVPQDIEWERLAVGDQVFLNGRFSCCERPSVVRPPGAPGQYGGYESGGAASQTTATIGDATTTAAGEATAAAAEADAGAETGGSASAAASAPTPRAFSGLAVITGFGGATNHRGATYAFVADPLQPLRRHKRMEYKVEFGRMVDLAKPSKNAGAVEARRGRVTRGHRVAVKFD